MNRTLSLTEGSIAGVLLRFSVPFLLANLLQALYGAVDLASALVFVAIACVCNIVGDFFFVWAQLAPQSMIRIFSSDREFRRYHLLS